MYSSHKEQSSDWFLTKLPLKPGKNPDCLPSGKSFQIFKLHLNSKRREKERERIKNAGQFYGINNWICSVRGISRVSLDTAARDAQAGIVWCLRRAGAGLGDPWGSLPPQDIPWVSEKSGSSRTDPFWDWTVDWLRLEWRLLHRSKMVKWKLIQSLWWVAIDKAPLECLTLEDESALFPWCWNFPSSYW